MAVALAAGGCVDSADVSGAVPVWESEPHAIAANAAANRATNAAKPYFGNIRFWRRLVIEIPRAATIS